MKRASGTLTGRARLFLSRWHSICALLISLTVWFTNRVKMPVTEPSLRELCPIALIGRTGHLLWLLNGPRTVATRLSCLKVILRLAMSDLLWPKVSASSVQAVRCTSSMWRTLRACFKAISTVISVLMRMISLLTWTILVCERVIVTSIM